MLKYKKGLTGHARRLRKESTLSEVLLWKKLRAKQIRGYGFNRQKPVGNYIIDFYCKDLKLAIEIDGATHYSSEEKDREKDDFLGKHDISVLRFGDKQVKDNLHGVVLEIEDWINKNCQY